VDIVFDLWMACHTQEEIAGAENVAKSMVNEICSEMADLPKLNKSEIAAAEHATDFDLQCLEIYFSNAGPAGRQDAARWPRRRSISASTRKYFQ
jgi:hypothetical protein